MLHELQSVVFVAELIGVLAFAIAGALKAIERDMDIFGILVLALITALGGGMIRDILIHRFPVSLQNPYYFYVATAGGLLALMTLPYLRKYLYWVKFFDALGLAVFSILGAQVGLDYRLNFLSVLLLGLLTGIGGGVLRDVLANEVPMVLRQEVYALASLAGIAVFWALAKSPLPPPYPLIAGIAAVFAFRLAAIRWNLNLPRAKPH